MKLLDAGALVVILAAYWVIADLLEPEPMCYVTLPDAPYLAKIPCSDVQELEVIE